MRTLTSSEIIQTLYEHRWSFLFCVDRDSDEGFYWEIGKPMFAQGISRSADEAVEHLWKAAIQQGLKTGDETKGKEI